LEVERKRLLALLDQIPGFVCLLAPDYTVRFANQSFLRLFGDPIGRTCYQTMRGLKHTCADCSLDRVLRQKVMILKEWRLPAGRIYQVYCYPFSEADGSPRVLKLGIDITDRRTAEQALKLERDKFKGMLDAMEDGVYIVDQHYKILYANPALMREFGAPNLHKCYEYLSDRKSPCPWCKNGLVLGGQSLRWEWYFAKAGKTFDLFDTPIRNEDGTVSKLAILHDITGRKHAENELRKSEDRYRMLVETMNEGLGMTDENLRVTYVNEKLCEMLGYQKDEVIGRKATEFLDEHNRVLVEKRRAKREFSPYELVWTHKDGSKIPTTVSPKAILGPENELKGSFAVITDITERLRSEEALRESERQLRSLSAQLLQAQEAERRRISHELHDELGQALSLLKLRLALMRKHLRKDQDSLRADCDDTLKYLNQVIDDVRRLSRDLSPSILEDLGLVTALRRLVAQFEKLGQYEVVSRIDDIDRSLANGARINLFRIFQEALTNIQKHASARTVSISVTRKDRIVICLVEDDGKGFNVAQVTGTNPAERGMGLAIIGERVRMLGGSLDIQSEPGRGTRISFSFPIEEAGRR